MFMDFMLHHKITYTHKRLYEQLVKPLIKNEKKWIWICLLISLVNNFVIPTLYQQQPTTSILQRMGTSLWRK